MAGHPQAPHGVGDPARSFPVAMLGRTSTRELQDPFASISKQITSAREWLPDGFHIVAYFWDVESGGLDLDQRGHGTGYQPYIDKGLPRDGGLADLIAEARSGHPRFAAVVCEDINRSARDTLYSMILERDLQKEGIPVFATDEPLDIEGVNPTTLLIRRTKQTYAEYFRYMLKHEMWKGMRQHAAEGYNLGKVPDGYLARKIPHPVPSKAAQGRTKTILDLDPDRAPIIAAIYRMRAWEHLGVPTIFTRLTADPVTYPPADPETGWTLGGIYAILRNPKYTGYQVFGRRRKGRPVPPGKWYWSAQATHPAIVDRDTWDAAQTAGAEHSSTRDGHRDPDTWRTYPLRSRIRCKLCKRRMCGTPKVGSSGNEYAYYMCQYNPANPGHVAAAPDHPKTVLAREDLLLATLQRDLSRYALAPGRAERLKELIPADAAAAQAKTDTQATALKKRLKQLDTAQDSLIHELGTLPTDPASKAAQAMRARIHAHFEQNHAEQEKLSAELAALSTGGTSPASDPALIDRLPELAGSLADLPPDIQAELFAAFDIQILWNPAMKQATFHAAISDTTPGIVAALLARAGDDGTTTTSAAPATDTATRTTSPNSAPRTSSAKVEGSFHLPMLRKTVHDPAARAVSRQAPSGRAGARVSCPGPGRRRSAGAGRWPRPARTRCAWPR